MNIKQKKLFFSGTRLQEVLETKKYFGLHLKQCRAYKSKYTLKGVLNTNYTDFT